MSDSVVIVGAARTPIASFQGELASFSSPQLGGLAIKEALVRAKVKGEEVGEVLMGCVLPAGVGQAPARQASIAGGIPNSVGATTVNKVCGSGLKSVMLAHDLILAGTAEIIVAGGMESMTNAPYLLEKARGGYRLGHGQLKDHMFLDGLEDAYDKGKLMGVFAEMCAEKYGFTREMQDAFALESLARAKAADFSAEIIPVTAKAGIISTDEGPRTAKPDKIPNLKPAFKENGTVTAANASSISDGAAALVLMKRSLAEKRGATILATITGHASHAEEPAWFTTAPIGAIKKLPAADLYEINEAFAVVTMAAMKELNLSPDKVNIKGGACALGHPIGASGARLLVTLIHALKERSLKRGIASLCIGGGEAVALGVEV